MSKGITRRDFLKGAAAGAVSVAAMSLVGCSKQGTTPTPAAASTPAPTAVENQNANLVTPETAAANLNPQDYDYTGNTITDFSKTTLFSPWKLGPLNLTHRMVKSAAGSDTWVRGFGEEMITYYTNFAKGASK
jgi:hypothetical protein